MAKITKAELKIQKDVQDRYLNLPNEQYLSDKIDTINYIYEFYDPSMDDNISERGVFFTPIGLCRDFNIFTPKYGHVVDVCSGIGGLSAQLLEYAYYDNKIESLTLIEYSSTFLEKSQNLICHLSAYNSDRRVVQINYIQGDAYSKETWDRVIGLLPASANSKFDLFISNPPYGKLDSTQKEKYKDHLKYTSERELMALELCIKYSNYGLMIIPPSSSDKQFSGRPYLDRRPSNKLDRFRKIMGEDVFFEFEIDGIDTSIYRDEWKGTSITTEVVSVNLDRNEYK